MKSNFLSAQLSRDFLRRSLAIALPVALQALIASSLSMIDTAMISPLGELALAGVGLVSSFFIMVWSIVVSLSAGAEILYSRTIAGDINESGALQLQEVTKIAGSSLALVSGLFVLAGLLVPKQILSLYTDNYDLQLIGADYLSYLAPSFFFFALTSLFGAGLRTSGRPRVPFYCSLVGFVTNIILNAILIYGLLGVPAMGVKGAALATSLARLLEFILIVFASRQAAFSLKLKSLKSWQAPLFLSYCKLTFPIFLTDFFWGLSQNVLSKAYAYLGPQAIAAMQVMTTIGALLSIFLRGISSATVVQLGHLLAGDKRPEAIAESQRFLKLTLFLGLLMMSLLTLCPQIFLVFFDLSQPGLAETCLHLLRVKGFVILFEFLNILLLGGILRAGADSLYVFKAEGFVTWFLAVPFAFLAARWLGWPIHYSYALVSSSELVKLTLLYWRYRQDKWIRPL